MATDPNVYDVYHCYISVCALSDVNCCQQLTHADQGSTNISVTTPTITMLECTCLQNTDSTCKQSEITTIYTCACCNRLKHYKQDLKSGPLNLCSRYKDKDKDKDLFIGPKEFIVGYSKAPE